MLSALVYGQAGHVMQGVGAVNMSMGGAATAQPLDISGALQWNPAAISTFDSKILDFNFGLFYSSPELSSSMPAGAMWSADAFGPGSPASPATSGVTLELNQNIESDNVYVGFYDVHGKLIKRVDVNQNSEKYIYVDVQDLSSGYYIVRLFDGQSEKQPIRFIKQ